jgi:hypothetical protein
LELISGRKNVQSLTVGALAGDETLEVVAVSQIWKISQKK